MMLDLVQTPHTLSQGLNLLFAFLIGHSLADFPLQGDFLALHKNRHHKNDSRALPGGIWVYCLLAHCLIHAGMVWVISGRALLGVAELVIHTVLDFLKCENVTGFHLDQALHVATKVVFVWAIIEGWVS